MKKLLYQAVSLNGIHANIKKTLLLCLLVITALCACGGSDDITEEKKPSVEETEPDDDNSNKDDEKAESKDENKESQEGSGTEEDLNSFTVDTDYTKWTQVELPSLPEITASNTFNIVDYGASTTFEDNTEAVQKALDAAGNAGGGMVIVPAGEWLCGPVVMKSKTKLYLKDGATVKLLPFEKYPVASTDKDGKRQYDNFIDCEKNATDIVVEGESKTGSVFDGQGAGWWIHVKGKGYDDEVDMKRGCVIRFSSGKRFLLDNFTIKDSPGVNITISQSGKASHATIHDIIIREPSSTTETGQKSHNTDGIAIWGPYVNIYNCDISNGDDNIVVDSNGQYVHVWDCVFGDGHGASIGSYTENVHDIIYERITFNGTESCFRLKSQRGRSGDVYNIICRDCTMTGSRNPIYIECWYDKSTKPVPNEAETAEKTSTTPAYRDILLQNIKSTGTEYNSSKKANFPIYLYGLPESYVQRVIFDNVQIEAQKGMFLAFCKDVKFINGCKITNTRDASTLIETQYEADIKGKYDNK